MNKYEFLTVLRQRLTGLPEEDIERSLDYYSEIIDDRMEDGMSEEEAVAALGPLEEIVSQIWMETSLPKLVKARVKHSRGLKAWEIILLILGSPVWLPLVLAGLVVLLALYIVLWAMILVLYAVDLSAAVSGIAGLFSAFPVALTGRPVQGAALFGGGLACAGLAVLLFFGFNQIAKFVLFVSKKIILAIKARFVRGGSAL